MSKIMEIIENLAPTHIAEEWDNVGLLVGRRDADVSRVLVALDVLDAVIDEAIAQGAEAIITHHPPIFKPISRISDESPLGRRLLRLIENKICLYTAHTNLDATDGGINDMLFDIFQLQNKEYICETRPGVFLGRAGVLSEATTLLNFTESVKNTLGLSVVTYCGDGGAKVHKIGVIGGASAGADFFKGVLAAGCDTFVTGDVRFHAAQAAIDMGLSLVDATHYGGEVIFAESIAKYLQEKIGGVEIIVSKIDGQPFKTVSCGGGN
ncbi:MAG: Nif3-like dinuclear metal center hexameric protein [Defluviitaleaceae bacterium]|nr:Nif3-like dinuclear metal center hexameric protein [Defluviitaleaceae bacterium]